jgi:hypothetical protein
MKAKLSKNIDFLSGMIFIIIGLVAVVTAQKNYPMGTSLKMGPGYFPTVLGYIMTAFGLYVTVRGLIKGEEKVEGVWGVKPAIMVSLGLAAFGLVMNLLGLIPALIVMIFVSAFGGPEFKFKEVLILAVVLTVMSWGIFIYGLNMPLRLFFWGN